MGLRDRVRRLEGPRGPEDRCPECGGRIILEEHHEDGTVAYPFGGPCSACGNAPPWPGAITKIVVRLGGRTGGDGEENEAMEWP